MLEIWLILGALYATGAILWIMIFRRLGKQVPPMLKRIWIFSALVMVFIIVWASLAPAD